MKYFALTNDPDHGKVEDYRKILRALSDSEIFVTTAVFCKLKDDDSPLARHCYEGETNSLEDKEYRDLMLEARDWGHEIAFHGYSQVSDTREEFLEGLDIFSSVFGEYPKVYFEHGGHPMHHPSGMIKKENLSMYGSTEGSNYYVKDIVGSVFDVVWTHDYLMDHLKEPLNLKDIFTKKEEIVYVKRWRMCHFNNIVQKLDAQKNTIVGYTHFGYKGYRSSNPIKRYFDKASFLERWLSNKELNRSIEILDNFINTSRVRSVTLSELYRIACQNE